MQHGQIADAPVYRHQAEPDSPRTILITGSNGFIGSHAVNAALARGYRVKTFSRSLSNLPPAVRTEDRFVGELPHQIPDNLLAGVNAVVHCAAWVGRDSDSNLAHRVNVEGTVGLAKRAVAEGVQAFVFLSSQSASPTASSAYGRSKFLAEQALLAMADLNSIILRPGLVCGRSGNALYHRMQVLVERSPVLLLPGGGRSIVQPIHIDDLCTTILECIIRAESLSKRILCVGDPVGVTLHELLQSMAVAVKGRRTTVLSIPLTPIKILVHVAEQVGLRLPVTGENLKGLESIARMETEGDMELLGLKRRPLESVVCEGSWFDAKLRYEASMVTRYLIGVSPSRSVQDRYAAAMYALKIDLDQVEQKLWNLAVSSIAIMRLIDGGLALVRPESGIRRKIYTMLAILECSPDYTTYFLPRRFSPLQCVILLLSAARAVVVGALGALLVALFMRASR